MESNNTPADKVRSRTTRATNKSGSRSQARTSQSRSKCPIPSPASSQVSVSQSIFTQAPLTSHPGVIKSLRLTNFMCHSDFTHDFHQNLNFITGQNGSGKSALLSGILIALGGKAAVTSRTTSLKALVQKGKHTGKAAVTLLNKNGLRGYGDEITIERSVNINGYGGYKIKSSGGDNEDWIFNWRPLKKPELDRILLGLSIQIDNPVAILNQEVARSFLRSKDPKTKFKLFYDGTLLSKLETVIAETKEIIESTDVILSQKKVLLDAVKEEVIVLKQKHDRIEELEKTRKQVEEKHNEYVWSHVVEKENSVKETERKIEQETHEIQTVNEKVEKVRLDYSRTNEESILREQAQVREELTEKQEEMEKTRAEFNEVRRNIMNLKAQSRTTASTIQSKEQQINKLSTSIDKVKADQAAKAKENTSRDAEMLSKMQDEKKHLDSVIVSLKSDAENFQQAADQQREKLQELENEARRIKTQIESKRRHITALNSRNANKYTVFGAKMVELMAKIQANLHRFRRQPKGPLGACFRVKDPHYAPMIEAVLINTLDSFVVGDPRDLNLLRELIDSVYVDRSTSQQRPSGVGGGDRKPSIHCMKYSDQMYDISRSHATHPDAPSILQLIEVENDDHIVANALIDIAEIEKSIVFRDNKAAASVLKNENTVPRSLKYAYTLQFYKFTPAPKYAARVMKVRNRAEKLKSGRSKEAEIETIKYEMKTLEQEIKNLEPKKAAIAKEERSFRGNYDEKTKEIGEKRRQLVEVCNDIKRHNAKIKEKERECDLTSYYEELQELRDDLQNQLAERDTITKKLEPLAPKLSELENVRKTLDKEIQDLNNKMSGFEEIRDKKSATRMKLDNVIKKLCNRVTTLESSKSNLNRDLESKKSELKEKMDEALKVCSKRVPTKRSPDVVKKDFESMKVRLEETQAQLGNVDELKANLADRQQRFRALKSEYVPLYKLQRMVKSTHVDQTDSFEKMRSHMGRTLVFFFSSMAKQRGYEGRLLVEFDTKELYYFVCPDADSASLTLKVVDGQERRAGLQTAEQLKQNKISKKKLVEYSLGLSGGERSFATICFIMALWQVMECPFYMLDEFDVFMDAFNRKTSQVALMTHAKRFPQNQFVLFTPLDLGVQPAQEDACVLRLYPPVRSRDGGSAGSNNSTTQQDASTAESSPQEVNAGNSNVTDHQATLSSSGRHKRASESLENIDPKRPIASKGAAGSRSKRRRIATGTVMSVIQ